MQTPTDLLSAVNDYPCSSLQGGDAESGGGGRTSPKRCTCTAVACAHDAVAMHDASEYTIIS
jgi:hypothetical protein